MNILKRRVSLLLCIAMLAVTILPIVVVNAAEQISLRVTLDSKTMTDGSRYVVEGGETININTTAADGVTVTTLGYYFDSESIQAVNYQNSVSVTVPTGTPGTEKEFHVAASGRDADGNPIQLSWRTYTLVYEDDSIVVNGKDAYIKYNSEKIENGDFIRVAPGDSITLVGEPAEHLTGLYYQWDDGKWYVVKNASSYVLEVPSDFENGTKHYLSLSAKFADSDDYGVSTRAYGLLIEEENETQVSMTVTLDGKTMKSGNTYEVKGGEKIAVKSESSVTTMEKVGYYYADEGYNTIKSTNGANVEFTLPTLSAGTRRTLYIEAVASNDIGDASTITKTGWTPFILKYVDDSIDDKDINVKYNGTTLKENSSTSAYPNQSIQIVATPADRIAKLYFRWDSDSWSTVNSTSTYSTRIPSSFLPGSTHWLYVKAEYDDGTMISEKAYKFVIPAESSLISMNVKLDSATISEGKTYEVAGGEKVNVTTSVSNSKVSYIEYQFGTGTKYKVNSTTATFEVPERDEGTTLNLYIEAVAEDGSTTGVKTYTLKYVSSTDGKLDIEPWMEENDEITGLSINLRNDSYEEEKANKNIYALDEIVTYYIDYKNGTGDDITSTVTIKLELPLDFTVSNRGGGTVDSSENEIEWIFEDGLKEDESGTLIVKLKYTALSKSKYDSELIYPSAAILRGKKEMDRSTVINLIITGYDEEIDEEHEPYMYGDANKDTFRPNDTITRAEGALVLARIYGLDYERTTVTNLFSDLDETYVEAQKAIIAATRAGLINGYTNGTYKPNATMTKAEFMKILACMVEANAEDEGIEGLEVKSVDDLIKVYEDSTRYYIVDGKKVYTHWALEEVSLLARLNMTPLSEEDDEIDLDEEITRAEVAQLVNFYLLRAPAYVTSKTDSGFSDVSKRHELFADIIEATREAHTFSMNEEDGTEVEE